MTPDDSLAVLTTLFGVVVTIMVFILAIVSFLICQDRSPTSASSVPSIDLVAEQTTTATGVGTIVILLLAGALAAGQIIHWAWS